MTNDKQQTPVDWFAEKTFNQIELLKHSCISEEQFLNNMLIFREQAKEMEKEQKSIELPSDEEIWDRADEIFGRADSEQSDVRHLAFMESAKWMRNKIQGGNK